MARETLEKPETVQGEKGELGLFSPLAIRDVRLRNRIGVSPMCQYSSVYGMATDWHMVHLGSRAVGGAGLVMVEATAVEARGRISPQDMGIWEEKHIQPLRPIAEFIEEHGAVPGIQLAHAGRKACTHRPWEGGKPLTRDEGAWQPVGASPIPFAEGYQVPHQLSIDEISAIVERFAEAAQRAVRAGFRLVEVHSAHGYLLHSFLSPVSNKREDEYGGSLENRMRLLLEVTAAVRAEIGEKMPLLVRISASDWIDGGWDLDQSVVLARELAKRGVDLVDCSSGGVAPEAKVEVGPGYQVPFADGVRRDAGIKTAAVGMITSPQQADEIIRSGKADLVLLAREMLRDPYWPLHAAAVLGQEVEWPPQYHRARP